MLAFVRNKEGRRGKRISYGDPPIVAWLRAFLHDNNLDAEAVSKAALGEPTALSKWMYTHRDPKCSNAEAVLNTLGYRIEIVPMEKEH